MNPFFDKHLALELATLCDRAYSEATIRNPQTDAQCLIEADETIRIAFRGSKTIRDWLQDGRFWQTRVWGGNAHAGFHNDVSSIIVQLIVYVRGLLAIKERPILFGGHSLGGGEAPLAAETFFRQGIGTIQAVYTFGQPRTFDIAAARAYNRLLGDRTIRVVAPFDLVPHVPFPDWIFRYWHHDKEALLPKNNRPEMTKVGKVAHDAYSFFKAHRIVNNLNFWDSVKEHHSIGNYIGKIQALPQ